MTKQQQIILIFSAVIVLLLGIFFFTYNKTNPSTVQPGTTTATSQGKCFVGGCSSQICSDQPNAMSTCEYRPEYSCYKNAVCERQSSGQCGWTQTGTLISCLESSANIDVNLGK